MEYGRRLMDVLVRRSTVVRVGRRAAKHRGERAVGRRRYPGFVQIPQLDARHETVPPLREVPDDLRETLAPIAQLERFREASCSFTTTYVAREAKVGTTSGRLADAGGVGA